MKCPLKDWVKCEILPRNGLRMKWYQRTEWYLIDQVNIIWNDIIWKDIKEENDIWLPESISGESPSREKCCLLIGSTRKPSTQFNIWPSTYFHVLRSWYERKTERKKHPNYSPKTLLFPHFWRGEWVRFVEYVKWKAYQLRKSQSIYVYRFLFQLTSTNLCSEEAICPAECIFLTTVTPSLDFYRRSKYLVDIMDKLRLLTSGNIVYNHAQLLNQSLFPFWTWIKPDAST